MNNLKRGDMTMAIIRWHDLSNVNRPIERLQREMNRLLTDFGRTGTPFHGVFPPVNVTEDGDNLYIRAELPGIRPEDMDLSVEGETVTLRGERIQAQASENVSYHRHEREVGRFRRIISLPTRIDPEGASASFKNGVLKISLPKAKEAKPRQIQVGIG
jgi:HSP20 family protein